MSAQQSPEELRIERLLAMAARLIDALEKDIASLKSGNARDLRTVDPEIQKLSALYSREAAALNPKAAIHTPLELRKRLFDTTKKFRDLLSAQTRLLTRLRGASEGMIRAVAEEIERRNAPLRGYGATPAQAPRPRNAMLYNSVI
jgi:uncharacterized membrane protein YccC